MRRLCQYSMSRRFWLSGTLFTILKNVRILFYNYIRTYGYITTKLLYNRIAVLEVFIFGEDKYQG